MTATIPEQRSETRTGKAVPCDRPGCDQVAVWLGLMDCGCTIVACTPCKEECEPKDAGDVLEMALGLFECAYCGTTNYQFADWEPLR